MDTQRPDRPEQNLTGLTAAATSVESLPSTGTDVPGLWIVATRSGTRYVIVVPPEGHARVNRVASYGWSRNEWRRLYYGVSRRRERFEEPLVPAEVGARMHVDMGPSHHDYYGSTEVVSILSYPLPALLSVDEVESYAHAATRDSTIGRIAAAYREGRIDDAAFADVREKTGIALAEVQERLR